MTMPRHALLSAAAWLLLAASGLARASLAPPSPAQAQAAAAKKAAAEAQAQKDKQELLASMDAVAGRWRSKAASQGWRTNPPVPVAAPSAAVAAPATVAAPPGAGIKKTP